MAKWIVDSSASEVNFTVVYMMVSEVTGSFERFKGCLVGEPELHNRPAIEFTIETASITTANKERDDHLRSSDFFDAAVFPAIHFSSGAIRKKGDSHWEITGQTTMKGKTCKQTYFAVLEQSDDLHNLHYRITGSIDRRKFGLMWNKTLETGGMLVSPNVSFLLDIHLTSVENS